VTGRRDTGWMTDLADMLAEAGQFLRSPQGHAALRQYYGARSVLCPGAEPGYLTDWVGFTELWLRSKIAQHTRRP
jgi:hypothetical protein